MPLLTVRREIVIMLVLFEANVKEVAGLLSSETICGKAFRVLVGTRVIVIANWWRPIAVTTARQERLVRPVRWGEATAPGRSPGWRADDRRAKEVSRQESAEP